MHESAANLSYSELKTTQMKELSIPVRVKRHLQEETARKVSEKLQALAIRSFGIQYGIDTMTVNVYEPVPDEKVTAVHEAIAECNPLRID